MYCPQCGAANDSAAQLCVSCGGMLAEARGGGPASPRLPSYLAFAIVTAVCCCSPAGVPAVFFAARVGPLEDAGRRDAARDASSKALIWSLVALGLGLVAWAGGLLVNVAALRDLGNF